MAAGAIGSGTISFGLVAIPVKLHSTVDKAPKASVAGAASVNRTRKTP